MSRKPIQSHHELEVYQLAFEAAMQIFELSKRFPVEERYSGQVGKYDQQSFILATPKRQRRRVISVSCREKFTLSPPHFLFGVRREDVRLRLVVVDLGFDFFLERL